MKEEIIVKEEEKLAYHLQEVSKGERRFENAFQSVIRMILEDPVKKIVRGGKTIYDYKFFRRGKRHIIGWYDELNAFVTFVKESAEGRSSRERAFVFVGPPSNGKTFTIDYICDEYRKFILKEVNGKYPNMRYTFEFVNLQTLGEYGGITEIQSQTLEDPMILAMNLFDSRDKNIEFLQEKFGFDDKQIDEFLKNYRPLGACSRYIWSNIFKKHCNGELDRALEFVRIVPQPIAELDILTVKYSAKDKITASAIDIVGEEAVDRLLHLPAGKRNPYRIDVQKGVAARAGGGGILFVDEIFKSKTDLINIFLQLIQPRKGEVRQIEVDGFKWPIDCLIICTSNDEEYNRFISEQGQGPIKDRCSVHFAGYITDYKLQQELVSYELGSEKISTLTGEKMHVDPNLSKALSIGVTMTRLPRHEKLNPVEMLKLEAGETAGEKDVKTLVEIKDILNANIDVSKRWGQSGLSQREAGKIFEMLTSLSESNEGKCLYALDVYKAMERVIKDNVTNATLRDKFLKDIPEARKLHRKEVKASIYNAYRNDPTAINQDVMAYVNMIIGIGSPKLGPDKIWTYKDPQTGELKPLKIDERFIDAVETRIGLTTQETKETFRQNIRKVYAERIPTEPEYDFTEDERLVSAVTEVRTESDVGVANSLQGALTNRTNKDNLQVYNRMLEVMINKLGYCSTCAEKTIEYWCIEVDE